MEIIQLTEEQFEEQFTTVKNHIDTNASWDGCMFETFGEESEHINSVSHKNVWTIVEGDDDTIFISNGIRLVNRMGFLITREEWIGETDVEIDMSMD
jgi:hypothetical protein